jgi:redox-sensitive bicupin YhaK (pirin superfamily)
MSFSPGPDPKAGDKYQCDALKQVVVPRTADLGDGFTVKRALPSAQSRMVGPFVFFDHFGPAVFKSGHGLDVRPHPHIGLATVTYLFDGEIMHRDSLGTAAPIKPGEVNWMTAGRGIVHSERTGQERRVHDDHLHGLQMWVALPADKEEIAPDFAHYAVKEFPVLRDNGKNVRIVVGSAYGERSPVKTTSDTLFADAHLKAGSTLPLDADYEERAIYVIDGEIDISGDKFGGGRLLVFKPGDRIAIRAQTDAHIALFGGAAMDGPRHIWWNFVSSRKERIDQAKAEWAAGHFQKVPGDEIEFIPLPEK